jgi:hypothetical protein
MTNVAICAKAINLCEICIRIRLVFHFYMHVDLKSKIALCSVPRVDNTLARGREKMRVALIEIAGTVTE